MAKKISVSNLNATTIEILNVIRQNASAEYQSLVPEVTVEKDIPKVGEVLLGYPALANQFLSASSLLIYSFICITVLWWFW